MTFMRGIASATSAIVLAAALAGCVSSANEPGYGPMDRPPTAAGNTRPTGVEGQWVGTDGVAVSTLTGGKFSSASAKTGETLTTGTYASRDQRTIDLDFYSLKSQQSTRATCILADINQMNCTLSSGTQFVLTRKLG